MSFDEKLVIGDTFLQNVEDVESSLNMAYITLDALVATQNIQDPSPSVVIDAKLRSVEERMRQLGDVIAKLRSDANSVSNFYKSINFCCCLSGSLKTVFSQSSGMPHAFVRQSSGSRQAVVRQSSGSRQAVVRQL